QRDYDLSVVGLTGKLDPHTSLSRYVSTNSRNFTNYRNPEFDRLIDEGIRVSGPERKAVYDQAQEIMTKDVAAVFIMDPMQLNVLDAQIKGWLNYPVYVIDVAALYK
ncbi:MAG: ABC transporter substrate-binding protein, partial [Limnochordia bacterium]